MRKIGFWAFILLFSVVVSANAQENERTIWVNISFLNQSASVEGFSFSTNCFDVGIEQKLKENHFFILSGWEVGYEKELSKISGGSYGHYIVGKITLRNFNLKQFLVSVKGGAKFGKPTASWYRAEYDADGMKHVGVKTDRIKNYGSFNTTPFIEAELEKKWNRLSFGAGVRFYLMKFGVHEFNIDSGISHKNRSVVAPSFFGELGIQSF